MTSDGRAPEGPNRPDVLPNFRKPKPDEMWICRVCGKRNVDKVSKTCVQCGRDYWGNPVGTPAPGTQDD